MSAVWVAHSLSPIGIHAPMVQDNTAFAAFLPVTGVSMCAGVRRDAVPDQQSALGGFDAELHRWQFASLFP